MSENEKITPNLYKLSNLIEKNKALIGTDWVKISSVKAVFDARKISIKKFRDGYGIPIIEYFISVVREEKDAGDCPIMSKLVNYLISKDITPREVFDICIGFRGTLILFLLKQEIVLKNPIPFMEEVALIFNANLSGVLDIFTNLYSQAQKKIEIAKTQRAKLQQTLKIINFINTKIIIIQNGRIILANNPFLEMLGIKNLKELYNQHKNGFDFLSSIDIYENDFRVNTPRWIRRVCKNNKPFRCEIYNKKEKKKFSYSGRITLVPDEGDEQFIITLNNITEHLKDEKALEDLLHHDELTGFRNYPTFEKFISLKVQEVLKDKGRLFLAVADIPDLRDINESNGRDKGDMVISEVAEDLRFLVDNNIYLGRLDGSRFGMLIYYPNEQSAYDWCVELLKKMNEREYRKTIAITEVDLSESINKLFLRIYDLVEESNRCEDRLVFNDFEDIIKYIELPNQVEFIDRLSKYKSINISLFHLGLAIASDVEIVSTLSDSVKVKLSSKQMKIADNDRSIYFKLDNIGNIKAQIKDIDENKKIVTIDRFRFDKHTPLSRKLFRIEVDEDIKAYIEDNGREFDVKILDMNYEYISIEIQRKRNFDISYQVLLDMLLPIDDIFQPCALNATITRIEKSTNGYKMVLLLNANDNTKQLLKKYISKCQMNIIQNFSI